MTSNLTREQTQQIIDAADAVISALAGTNDEVHKDDTDKMVRLWDGLNDKYAPPEVVRELARMALAAMDSEPVAFIDKQWTLVYFVPPMSMGLKIGDKLYRHAQQPVAPDESYKQLSELYHTQEKRLFKIAQRIKGPTFDKYSHLSSQAIDVLEAAIFGEDDTCRAAMLQAGNSPAIPDTWIPVSERIPIDFEAVIAFDGDQVYGEAMYSSDDGFTIDGYEPCDRLKLQNVTHWMPLPPPPKEVK